MKLICMDLRDTSAINWLNHVQKSIIEQIHLDHRGVFNLKTSDAYQSSKFERCANIWGVWTENNFKFELNYVLKKFYFSKISKIHLNKRRKSAKAFVIVFSKRKCWKIEQQFKGEKGDVREAPW